MKVLDSILVALMCTAIIGGLLVGAEKFYFGNNEQITRNHLVEVIGGDK